MAAIHPVILSSRWWQHVIQSTTASRKRPSPAGQCSLGLGEARCLVRSVHSQVVGPPTSLSKPMLTYLVHELPAQHSARRRLATTLLLSQGASQLPLKTHADISARMAPISTNSLLPIPTCSQPQTLTIDPDAALKSCGHLCLHGTRSAYALTLLLLWRQRSWGRQILRQGQGPLRAWRVPTGTRATVQSKGGIHRQWAFAQQFQTQGQAEGYSRAL